jgi:hypothetical protein
LAAGVPDRLTDPSDPQALKDTIGGVLTEFIGDPRDYLTEHFSALRDFYTTAADQDLAIVIYVPDP